MTDTTTADLLALNQRLLNAIAQADWATYQELCEADLTCFEPETRGQLVEGLPFHKFYFDLGSDGRPCQNTMASPRVRLLGADAAIITCVRLVQRLDPDDAPRTMSVEETRVWQHIAGKWRHVHVHRSPSGN